MHHYVPGPRAGLSPNEPPQPLLGWTEGLFTSTHEPEPRPFWRCRGLGPQIQKERLQGFGEWADGHPGVCTQEHPASPDVFPFPSHVHIDTGSPRTRLESGFPDLGLTGPTAGSLSIPAESC